MAASSLHVLSVNPQTLSLSKPKNTSFSSLSFPISSLKLSLSSSSNSPFTPFFSSRFARNVAVSSEFDQIEAVVEDENDDDNVFGSGEDEGEETNYSPDVKVFVGNLPFNVDSATLAGLFEQAGNVEMVEVIYDKVTGRSRGFGFVTMSTTQEAEAAARQFNGYELDGRVLRVNSGPPPPKRERSSFGGARGGSSNFSNTNRVYVGNLAWGVDNVALETLFSEQGRVMEAKVVYDRESGRSRGFGFVTYSSADEVNRAIEVLDGADLDGRPIRVSPAEARQRRQFDY